MEEPINYIGEHLWPGKVGHFAIIMAFVASIISVLAYYFATQRRHLPEHSSWKRFGRSAFLIHSASILTVIGLMFYVMLNKYYEYQYVQAHISDDLPFKYVFSAFWEGQEGSFLLWMFWHLVLGIVLIFTAKKWESPVMASLSLIQVFLTSMILGLYVGFGENVVKIGSHPLLLLRETIDAPIFQNAEYVSLIKGTGINTLLQNYWMTIHPPTLFLGFASTSIPFAFAVAGLWTGQHREWLRPAMPWALFSGAILGLGILMGGAWAYEALSFGGYWAWDPVENMSLVPWIILVGGIHTNMVAKNTGHAIKSTYLYYLLTFVLIVYSTFLTRSGVLGETSVHAFTEMGLEWQLVIFLGAFVLLSFGLYLFKQKQIPKPAKEEPTASKEFWMFIGTLVLLFSAILITGSTSLPVYNKVMQFFDPTFEGQVITDPVPHFNKYQLWIGVFIGLLSGFSQYLRYRAVNWNKQQSKFWIRLGATLFATGILTYLTTLWVSAHNWQYALLLFAGVFTVVTNTDYLISFLRGNLKMGASAFAHIGFGLMIVGIIASGLNQTVISTNPFLMEGLIADAQDDMARKNIMLFKGVSMPMNKYEVTYVSDTLDQFYRTYTVNFTRKNDQGEIVEDFNLYPNIVYNRSFTKIEVPNPSTRRYWSKDMFTVISALPEIEMDFKLRQEKEDSLHYQPLTLTPGRLSTLIDSVEVTGGHGIQTRRYDVELMSINRQPKHPDYEPEPGDLAVSAKMMVRGKNVDSVFTVEPLIVLRGKLLYHYPSQIDPIDTKIKLNESIFEHLFAYEDALEYQNYQLKEGETFNIGRHQVTFMGYQKQPTHPEYVAQEGDIAVGALLQINGTADEPPRIAQPIYFIRANRPLNVKDEISDLGLHFRFNSLDPKTGAMELLAAQGDPRPLAVPIEVATDSYRADWIVLQATEFPGINFFWFGSLMMIAGLGMGMMYRRRKPPAPTSPTDQFPPDSRQESPVPVEENVAV